MKINREVKLGQIKTSEIFNRNLHWFLLGLLFVFFIIGCNGKSESLEFPDVESLKKVKEVFKDNSNHETKNQKSPGTVNIFVDISYSNRGFISVENSDFLKSIRDLCAILNSDITINFFTFGNQLNSQGSNISSALNYLKNDGIFNNSETRFDILFNFLEGSKNQNSLNLIFTDGIHSENKNTDNVYVDLANYIRKFVAENYLFGLLGSKGNFSGTYYTESSCPDITGFIGKRPFYCFIFGARKHVEFVKTHLLDQWENHFLLYPPLIDEILIDVTKTNIGFDTNLLKDSLLSMHNFKKENSYSIRMSLKSRDFNFWDLNDFSKILEMKKLEIYPDPKQEKYKVEIKNEISNIDVSINTISFNGTDKLNFTFNFNPANEKGLCIYRLVLTPNVPGWINEWSTDSDCTAEDAQKTFGLKNFTRNLLKTTSDNRFNFVSVYFAESRR